MADAPERAAMLAALRYGGFRDAEETERVTRWAGETIDRLTTERARCADILSRVLAVSDPLPPDGIDVHVEAQRWLDATETA